MDLMSWLWLAVAVAGCELVGIAGAVFTTRNIPTWYAGLHKARLSPPNWIFGPVWTTLYALMGVSLWLAWRAGAPAQVLAIFFAQLILNFLWSPLFFSVHWTRIALFDIAALWLSIVATIWAFLPMSPWAAWLLAPYLLWVTFATYLNWAIVKLN
jgi:translocator protein